MSDFKKNDKRVIGSQKKRRDDRWSSPKIHEDLKEKVVYINRCAKVVKGDRRVGFSALVLVGDQKGRIGVGCGKAKEVPEAIKKGNERARKNMLSFDFGSSTVPHLAIEFFYTNTCNTCTITVQTTFVRKHPITIQTLPDRHTISSYSPSSPIAPTGQLSIASLHSATSSPFGCFITIERPLSSSRPKHDGQIPLQRSQSMH